MGGAESRKGTGFWVSCFPGNANIATTNGKFVRMSEVQIGQEIVGMKGSSHKHTSTQDKVLTFLHRSPTNVSLYLRLTTEDGEILEASPDHLIHVLNAVSNKPDYLRMRFIQVGDSLLKHNSQDNTTSWRKVAKVETFVNYEGDYSPLTTNGTLIVNGFVVSCYAIVDSHSSADKAMLPLKNHCASKFARGKTPKLYDGVHPYCNFFFTFCDKTRVMKMLSANNKKSNMKETVCMS